jgi:thiamine biosynthesis lipoprotein
LSAWPLLARHDRALNSSIEILLALEDPARQGIASDALDAALAFIHAVEARLSRFRPTSELSALNRAAGTWFAASADLWSIVTEALAWAEATGSLFDPTILPALAAQGYDRSFEQIAHRDTGTAQASPVVTFGAWRRVALDPTRRAIRLPEGSALDLGGIGKGWIADRLLDGPLAAFDNVLINLGGDLRVRGGPESEAAWIIGLRDPRRESENPPVYLGGVQLRCGGIATSGAAWRWWRNGDEIRHHLIDPRTGRPATTVSVDPSGGDLAAVTALAPTATAAEVIAKHALLVGLPDALSLLDAGRDRAGVCMLGDGRLVPSANLAGYLASQDRG